MTLLLSHLGLNKYEERVYKALIEYGTSTARDISYITNIPYGKVYEILKILATKGFLTILPTKPMKFQPVSPKRAVANVKTQIQKKLEEAEKKIISELQPIFIKNKKINESKSLLLLINGRSNINNKVKELIEKARDHIYIHTSEKGIKRLIFHTELLKDANKRGVKILLTGMITPGNKKDIKDFSFCNIKHTTQIHSQLISIDGKECLIVEPILDDENFIYGRDIGMLISNTSFTKLIENLYESYFEKCENVS